MKYFTFLLLLIAVNCNGQIIDTTKHLRDYGIYKKQPAFDSIPMTQVNGYDRDVPANWIRPFQAKIQDSTERIIYYDVWLGGHGKTYPAAYKIRDSAWVIKDSAEAFKMLL
jgi:hypothetical protein